MEILQPAFDLILNQGIWCALFVWLFYSTRQESQAREDKLMTLIEEHSQKLSEISETLATINLKIDNLEKETEKE